MSSAIVVVGAAGPTGLAAIRALAARDRAVRALVHRDEQADAVRGAGATEVAVIDLDDPATLAPALARAAAVLHIPPVFNAREPEQVQAVLDATRAAGIERFVQHSVMHPYTPGVRHHLRKAAAEASVRRSGMRWTILEPCMYASTIMLYWDRSPAGTVVVPYSLDTPFTPIALVDVAEATAIVLSESGHDFATYELGGPEVLTGREMLAQVCRVRGEDREVRRGKLSELALPAGWNDSARADMAAMCEHYDHVGLSGGGRGLEMLLGRLATLRRHHRLAELNEAPAACPGKTSSRLSGWVTISFGERATEGEAVNVATLEEPRLDGGYDDVAGQLEGALRIAARALGGPCELGWLDADREPERLRIGDPGPVPWEWLRSDEAAMPPNVTPLRGRDGRLLGGLVSNEDEPSDLMVELAADLALVLGAVLADQERFAAHGALIELSSQLHADELNTSEILRLIVERARQLIGVDVTWLGLIDEQDRVAIEVAAGARSQHFVDMWIDIGHGIGGLAVKERRTVVVPDHRLFQPNSTDLVIQTLGDEGVVSVLCAPLMFEGGAIGALYGGSRDLTTFSDTTIAVFTALASQAGRVDRQLPPVRDARRPERAARADAVAASPAQRRGPRRCRHARDRTGGRTADRAARAGGPRRRQAAGLAL